jgi:hypothetical protein
MKRDTQQHNLKLTSFSLPLIIFTGTYSNPPFNATNSFRKNSTTWVSAKQVPYFHKNSC